MRNENIELLEEEIKSELEGLQDLQLGTEEWEKTVNGVGKLMDRAIELKKFDAEQYDKEVESVLKADQLEAEKKDRSIKNILTALGIAIPTGAAIWGTLKSLKFEETGTVTTQAGRLNIGALFKGKR